MINWHKSGCHLRGQVVRMWGKGGGGGRLSTPSQIDQNGPFESHTPINLIKTTLPKQPGLSRSLPYHIVSHNSPPKLATFFQQISHICPQVACINTLLILETLLQSYIPLNNTFKYKLTLAKSLEPQFEASITQCPLPDPRVKTSLGLLNPLQRVQVLQLQQPQSNHSSPQRNTCILTKS